MKVVIDTCVVVDHFHLTNTSSDAYCSRALQTAKVRGHRWLVCEKLLREYRGVTARGDQSMLFIFDRLLMNMLPYELLAKVPDPKVKITFGPPEDRFHMQMAIDHRAGYHVTRDGGVLDEAPRMLEHGVKEAHPRQYVLDHT